jgi:menaquinone-dependent protoporphyrinogen oxidase
MTAPTSPDPDRLNIPRALVVYASTHGHTAKIATRIAQAMVEQHVAVDVRDVADAADLDPGDYDVVVVGASLHKERHQPAIAEWVSARSAGLEQRPSVFFSVSLSAADNTDTSRAATQHCIDEFCAQTRWTPSRTEAIADCLQYREYDVFTRQLMRLLMRRMGHRRTTRRTTTTPTGMRSSASDGRSARSPLLPRDGAVWSELTR